MQKSDLTKTMRWKIAEQLASDRLPQVNLICGTVKPRNSIYVRYVKRGIDIVVSVLALLLTFPINMMIGIITFFDLGHPIFFRQQRVGRGGRLFTIVKFRNMRDTTDENGELLPPEQRVTKIGEFMRKSSLDELLNFWSILKGDMSLIGPRPLVPEYTTRYNARHKMRLYVRPGLECPPRRKENHVWTWQEQFENDIWYVENVSFLTDLRLVFRLLQFALDRKSAKARANATRGIFMGYDLNGNAIILDDVPQEYIDMCDSTEANN